MKLIKKNTTAVIGVETINIIQMAFTEMSLEWL